MEELARRATELAYARQPEYLNYGEEGRKKSQRDMGYHLAYLAEAVRSGVDALFLDYLDWAATLFQSMHLPDKTMSDVLQCILDALREIAGHRNIEAAERLLLAGISRARESPAEAESPSPAEAPFAELASLYSSLLLDGKSREAGELIRKAMEEGTGIKDIYLGVFQPVLREIGRFWHTGRISVAKEHFCTAATSMIMARIVPEHRPQKTGARIITACVGDELHSLGIRMVTDFFELDGWDTRYLGPAMPPAAISGILAEWKPELLALSVTMTFHLSQLRTVIASARAAGGPDLKIIVGGYPFRISTELWRSMGADGCGRDAKEAVEVATSLLVS